MNKEYLLIRILNGVNYIFKYDYKNIIYNIDNAIDLTKISSEERIVYEKFKELIIDIMEYLDK